MSTPAEKREMLPVNDLEVRVIRLEERSNNAATKEDIANAVNALSKEIATVNANLSKEIAAVKQDVAELNGKIYGIEGKLSNIPTTIQVITIIFAVMAASFTLLKFGAPFLGH